MVLLNAPDAQQRILKFCNITKFTKSNLEFIAKHSNSTVSEVKKASEFFAGDKVPVTLFVDDLKQTILLFKHENQNLKQQSSKKIQLSLNHHYKI